MDRQNIFEQFLTSAHTHPGASAIQDAERTITYSELRSKAASIAQQLCDLGCQREELVPIITHGGVDMIAGMLACLQVAATFVPIDVSAPADRTMQMLEDLGSRIALADETLNVDHVVKDTAVVVRPKPDGACSKVRRLDNDSIIYGFFTSGSTGKPKCCLNTHLGLANRFAFNTSVKMLQVGDAVMQNSKHTFDPVLWQTLWPLTLGATVIIPERHGLLDIEKTIKTIDRCNVVMTDIVPSVLTVLLDYLECHPGQSVRLESLTELFVGGEEMSIQLLNRVRTALPWLRLTNTYGPTEAAIGMIYHHFDGSESADIPLGTPIPGTTAVILNEALEPVGDGTIGQLAIGGACLGKGYHNDQLKTDSAFKIVKRGDGEYRVFLTGDRAVAENGQLYFRGRTDKQIKIRGVRVELKEIEATFEEQPDVIQFRVVPILKGTGGTKLIAFFTARRELSSKDLRQYANDRLPKEFIPTVFRQISEFQTVASGKIDRSWLKKIAHEISVGDDSRYSTETLQELVQKLTGLTVGNHDNLFDSGLDSLNAVRLALEIETRFSTNIPVSRLYAHPTIEAIQHFIQSESCLSPDQQPDLSRWLSVSVSPKRPRNRVLLTGATGYFGLQLLSRLSKDPDTDVTCIVRSTSEAQAMSRLHRGALTFAMHDAVNWESVEIILGDLTLPGLGISEKDRKQLIPTLTAVYNAAAEVNFVKSFSNLEQVNVRAVVELAELAASAPDCHLHHISSTAVIGQRDGQIDAAPRPDDLFSMGGYAQSKLVAELTLQSISNNGLPVTVYRIGELMPSPTCPVPNPKSLVICYLRTLAFIGMSPSEPDSLDYCPVDAVAEQIVEGGPFNGLTVGLANQNRTSLVTLMKSMNQAGADIGFAPRTRVYEAIRSTVLDGHAPDYVLIIWSFICNLDPDSHWPILSYSSETKALLGPTGTWPETTIDFLSRALQNLTEHQSHCRKMSATI